MSYTALILSFLLLIGGCGSSEESQENEQASPSDSIEQAEAKTSSDTIPTPEPPGPGLSPGQAEIEAEVIDLIKEEKNGKCILSLEIHKVLGYGQSTDPLAVNDTLEVRVGEKKSSMVPGQKMTMVLQQNISSAEGEPTFPWSLVKIKE
jgi:hypothetical protein